LDTRALQDHVTTGLNYRLRHMCEYSTPNPWLISPFGLWYF